VFSTLQVSSQCSLFGHGVGVVRADAVTGAAEAVAGYSSLFRRPVSASPSLFSHCTVCAIETATDCSHVQ
jgi:hypothetical protein